MARCFRLVSKVKGHGEEAAFLVGPNEGQVDDLFGAQGGPT